MGTMDTTHTILFRVHDDRSLHIIGIQVTTGTSVTTVTMILYRIMTALNIL